MKGKKRTNQEYLIRPVTDGGKAVQATTICFLSVFLPATPMDPDGAAVVLTEAH